MWTETCTGMDEGVGAHLDDTEGEQLEDSLMEDDNCDPPQLLDRFLNTSRRLTFVNGLTAKVPSKKKHC